MRHSKTSMGTSRISICTVHISDLPTIEIRDVPMEVFECLIYNTSAELGRSSGETSRLRHGSGQHHEQN
jgi:hypothetical protein